MSITPPIHPYFEKPPVVEVACGMQFRPLVGLHAPLLGRLWSKIESEFPRVHTMPVLMPKPNPGTEIAFELTDVPPLPRIWFIHRDDEGVIQVQQDRFIFNWKRVNGGSKYPGFTMILEKFKKLVNVFDEFLQENHIGDIHLNQLELTYVDHLTSEGDWTDKDRIGQFFPDFHWRNNQRFLGPPNAINWVCEHMLPENAGLLSTRISLGKGKNETEARTLKLNMSIFGMPDNVEGDEIWLWYQNANKWISQAFVDITGDDVQKNKWGRTS